MARDIIPWRQRRSTDVETREDSPLLELHRRMNELFEDFFEGTSAGEGARWPALRTERRFTLSPSIDVSETDDEVMVTADLPGVDEENVQVTLENDLLTIKGEKHQEHEEKKRNYHMVERAYGQFQRVVPVPSGIQEDKIKAMFNKGVLTVHMPKTPEAKAGKKRIQISAA